MDLFDFQYDGVIRSAVIVGRATYDEALSDLFPLIDRFEEQRKIQRPKFYERLRKDILAGCIMPAITIAFVHEAMSKCEDIDKFSEFLTKNLSDGYILDGMQRLNTLKSASEDPNFDGGRPLLLNIIIAEKYDLLLYRMITLNNGQKPMTVRHQVEMLTSNLISRMVDVNQFSNIVILKEKETEQNSPKGSFRMADIASAYLAFLTDSPHNQNTRFIEEKLDEILVGKVMQANVTSENVKFSDILVEIDRLSSAPEVKSWLRNDNNLIGFVLGAKKSVVQLRGIESTVFSEQIDVFEDAFQSINPSKVNVGKFRRDLTSYFITNIGKLKNRGSEDLTEKFFELTAN